MIIPTMAWIYFFIRDIVGDIVAQGESWAYCDTAGVPETREFLAEHVNARGGVQITSDDILFFNGLGDAVAKVYGFLRREARILGPSPAYSTHSSAEAAHSGYNHVTYDLDPHNGCLIRPRSNRISDEAYEMKHMTSMDKGHWAIHNLVK